MTTYVTETGSKYVVRNGRWKKNDLPLETLYWAHGVDPEKVKECESWADVEGLERLDIKPGVRLYIGSRDIWWLSTIITEVIEDGED